MLLLIAVLLQSARRVVSAACSQQKPTTSTNISTKDTTLTHNMLFLAQLSAAVVLSWKLQQH
jgi:hypothetical protein